MKRTFETKTTAAIVAVLILAAGAAAQPMMGGMGGEPRGGRPQLSQGPPEMAQLGSFLRLLGALDLTEEQREDIRSVFEGARDAIRAELESTQSEDGRGRILELFASQDLTEADLLEVMRERDEVRDRIREIVAGALVDIHDILTAEQLRRLAEIVEEGPHGEGRHGGPGGGMRDFR